MQNVNLSMAVAADDFSDICDTVRKICEGFPGAYWRGLEDQQIDRRYPGDFVNALGEAGFLGTFVPEAFSGVELPIEAAAAIVQTIHESGCNGAACVAQMHLTDLLVRHGTEKQKQTYLPLIAEGKLRLQSLALTEPGVADDPAVMTTVAEITADGYSLSGAKTRVRYAGNTDLMVVLAKTTAPAEEHDPEDGMSLFLVDLEEAAGNGLEVSLTEEMNNDNAASVSFRELPLPQTALIGAAGRGSAHLYEAATAARILSAAAAIGDGRFFTRRGSDYAKERVVFGNPIGKYQGIQFPLAKAHIELEAATMAMRTAATLHDAGMDAAGAACVAKHLAVEAAWASADAAFTTHGGFAFAREYDIERKWRDVRAMRAAPTPFKTELAEIGEGPLGLPRSF